VVRQHGGQVVIIPLVGEYSTSRLVWAARTLPPARLPTGTRSRKEEKV
jgi:hypothetical protein